MMRIQVAARVLILGAIVGLSSLPASAQSDDFNDGNDNGWTHYDLTNFGAPATFSAGGGTYHITATPTNTAVNPARAAAYRTDVTYSDFKISVDVLNWPDSIDQAFGILGRLSNVGLQSSNGYAFTYVPDGDTIDISRITGEVGTPLTGPGASVTLTPNQDYRFEFTGQGGQLTGKVYDLANPNVAISTVTINDTTYASGFGGLLVVDRSDNGNVGADATFDNYNATNVVPEPGALSAVCALGSVLAIRPLRRRFI